MNRLKPALLAAARLGAVAREAHRGHGRLHGGSWPQTHAAPLAIVATSANAVRRNEDR
jgi:hypothetical protein